jgi:hypothetical protein
MTLAVQKAEGAATGDLFQHVHIIDPDFGTWHGRYQLKDAKVTVGSEQAAEGSVTIPQVKLMEQSEWLKGYKEGFQTLQSELKTAIDWYSEPFPIRGLRMIPHATAEDFLYEIIGKVENGVPVYDSRRNAARWANPTTQSIAYRLEQLADDFCDNYSRLHSELQANLQPIIWRNVCGRIPAREDLRKKFYLRVVRVRLAAADEDETVSARKGTLTVGDLSRYSSYIDAAARAQIDAAVAQATVGPREAFAEALRKLNDLIQRDGNITDRSFNAVRGAIAKLRSFAFIASPDLLEKAHQLEARIEGINTSAFDRDTAAASGFSALLTDITNQATSDVQTAEDVTRFGRAFRALDF